MIDYGLFRFASPPRTATSWFRKAAASAGLGVRSSAGVHTPHTPHSGVLTVSAIRNPADWLASYYSALEGGVTGVAVVDLLVPARRRSSCFSDFVDIYLDELPGAVGEMFTVYAADTVMRVEDQPWAAVELFQSVGVRSRKLNDAAQLPPQNVYHGQAAIMTRRQRRRVLDAESEFCRDYGYW